MPRRFVLAGLCGTALLLVCGNHVAAQQPNIDAQNEADGAASDSPLFRSRIRSSLFRLKKQGGLSPQEDAWVKDNCEFGRPELPSGVDLGTTKLIVREGYVLEHSAESKIPLWVCEHATIGEISGSANRDNSKFKPEPTLGSGVRAELKDYKASGYDRGHMAPAGNQKSVQTRMDETFYLSNMVPQIGPTFNRGIWAHLEDTSRKWVEKRKDVWIISGPMFYDPLEDDASTADGIIPYYTIGDDEVAVPTHCFKIVLSKNGSDWEALAFVMANTHFGQPYKIEHHRTTIDWIEKRTGLDFFPGLNATPTVRDKLERQVGDLWETN